MRMTPANANKERRRVNKVTTQPGNRRDRFRRKVAFASTLLTMTLVTTATLAAGTASPAHSAEREGEAAGTRTIASQSADPTFAERVQAMYWRGRTCATPACKAARPSGIAEVASFGLAAFGGAWFSRRRTG